MSTPGYSASARALRELSDIIAQTHLERGPDAADRLEERFFSAFRDLGKLRTLGHRRLELTTKDVLFYSVPPFTVVFRRRGKQAHILKVAHSARDLRRLL